MQASILLFFIVYSLGLLVNASFTNDKPSNQRIQEYGATRGNNSLNDDIEDYLVNFLLFTREHPDKFNLLQVQNKNSIKKSSFDPKKITKILISGWLSKYTSTFCTTLKKAFLKKYDANVIIVDWSDQSIQDYIRSRLDISKVAGVVAKMIDLLVNEFDVKSSDVHILGHSLGAHLAGVAGLKLTTGKISRVTGLDPAMPLFSKHLPSRIRPDSADFVDVIHTCGHVLGFKGALGQVDFYPNGGTYKQPGCGWKGSFKCSHARSFLFYAESIQSNEFLAVGCKSWSAFKKQDCDKTPVITMGEYTPRTARGSFYLRTNNDPPFARGSNIF